jgi:hypothetical protein
MRKVQFITNRDDLYDMDSHATILLGGELVFSSVSDDVNIEGFIRQRDRKAGPAGLTLAALTSKMKMKTWINKDVFSIGFAKRKHKVLCINDHYLKWGLSKKRDCIVVGGHCEQDRTLIEVFIFSKKNGLEKIDEMILCSVNHPDRFASELGIRIKEMQKTYVGYQIYWADPLQDLPESISRNFGVMEIGFAPFRKLEYYPIDMEVEKTDKLRGYQLPVFISVLAFSAYSGANYISMKKFNESVVEYNRAIAGVNSDDYKFGSSMLDLMQKRKEFMAEKSPQEEIVNKLHGMLGHLATIENVRVIEFETKVSPSSAPGAEQEPDIRIHFGVPKEKGLSALDQGNSILKELSIKYGMILYLKKDSVTESIEKRSGKDIEYRFFSVEGRNEK